MPELKLSDLRKQLKGFSYASYQSNNANNEDEARKIFEKQVEELNSYYKSKNTNRVAYLERVIKDGKYWNGVVFVLNPNTKEYYIQKRTLNPYRDKQGKIRNTIPMRPEEIDIIKKELGLI